MNDSPKPSPTFQKPPIVETILGVQFDQLMQFRSWHYGQFLRDFLPDWKGVADEAPLPVYEERFDSPFLKISSAVASDSPTPSIRMRAKTIDGKKSIQIQPDKLYFSWTRDSE